MLYTARSFTFTSTLTRQTAYVIRADRRRVGDPRKSDILRRLSGDLGVVQYYEVYIYMVYLHFTNGHISTAVPSTL